MNISAQATSLENLRPWRDLYRQEMNCQITHDSIHPRPGWTEEYFLHVDGNPVGYGSVAVSGPWKGKPTIYELYVLPQHRGRAFDLFEALRTASKAVAIEVQTIDPLLTAMLHTFARDIVCEKIVFQDKVTTSLVCDGVVFRKATADDAARMFAHRVEPVGDWIVEYGGEIAGTAGIGFHYNRPYGDIYMEVAEPYRGRGLGSYLVQELKRACYEMGSIPCARCSPNNHASFKTLQKAGFVPSNQILVGSLETTS